MLDTCSQPSAFFQSFFMIRNVPKKSVPHPVSAMLVRGKLVGSRAGNIHFLYSSDKHGSENVSAKKIRKTESITASHVIKFENVGLSLLFLHCSRLMHTKFPKFPSIAIKIIAQPLM